ncbi:hypothetical protein [Limosilactobacillus vaginalis]|uniref:hypothetical protein n=1 Tax=Limosilactobacillus vaginalis TaxID=1633 RepID=UPI002073E12F|nr:hypothetical protein [Limosilactobacillus vaginalis]
MSFHFDFDALENNKIVFPEDFMKDVYENAENSDLEIVLPGWKKFSDIENSELTFTSVLRKATPEFLFKTKSSIFSLINVTANTQNLDDDFEYLPEPENSTCYAINV